MPFDGADFPPPRPDPSGRAAKNDAIRTAAVVILASCLLLIPILIAAIGHA